MEKINFNSGPAMLPKEVKLQCAEAIKSYGSTGLSILEIPHRGDAFLEIMHDARTTVKELLHLNDDYEVLFLHGGASTQFMMVPYNLLTENGTAAYCHHGIWGAKAIKEAGFFGNAHIASSSQDKNHTYIPKQINVTGKECYLHLTTNNTVEGTQMHVLPEVNIPIVADMSSDIFSRKLDFNRIGLMYACVQKNAGAAGVTIVIVNKNILGKTNRSIPTMLDYRQHILNESILNTPPVFAVFTSMLTLKWIKNNGELEAMETLAKKRADLFYQTLDSLPIFKSFVNTEDRSLMNAVFDLPNEELLNRFIIYCEANNVTGIKGHRSAGGLRVSMYNAMPIAHVQYLCDLMKRFSDDHG